MKLTARQEAGQKEILAIAKQLVQATAVRLNMEKEEKRMKDEVAALMALHKFPLVEGTCMMDGRKATLHVTRKEVSTSSIDVDKLTTMLTKEQFMQCAKVTLTAAKEVLPQGLIDQCLVAGVTRVNYDVKADKGFPVPEVKLFR